jgi:hypothetical protein
MKMVGITVPFFFKYKQKANLSIHNYKIALLTGVWLV